MSMLHALCGSATPRAFREDSVPASFFIPFLDGFDVESTLPALTDHLNVSRTYCIFF